MKRVLPCFTCALIACLILIGCAASPYASFDQAAYRNASPLPETEAGEPSAEPTPATRTAGPDRQEAEPNTASPAYRPSIIYTAELGLRADRVDVVQDKAEEIVAQRGGYIGESSRGRLVIRIPAKVFDAALDDLATLGEVTTRQVHAQDATERVVDLESRLRSAEVLRQRLIELIQRAENVEHALKAEQELARVTEQIELMQGRLRLIKQQIAYSTITMTITPTPEEERLTPGIPIAWVRDLGHVFRERTTIDVSTPRRLRDGVDIELPEGFIRYYQENYITQAIDANGVRIRVRRFKNFDEGSLKFWEQLVVRALDENGQLTLEPVKSVEFERGGPGRMIHGAKKIAGEEVRHAVALGVSDDGDYVYCFEVWGVAQHVDSVTDAIHSSIGSMRCY